MVNQNFRHKNISDIAADIGWYLYSISPNIPANIRYGFRSTHLFYNNPTSFVAACAFLIAILMAIKPYVRKFQKWIAILLILMCSSLRSKAFAAVFVFCIIYYFVFIREKKITLKTFLIFVPVIVFMVGDQIEYYFFSDIQSD